MAPKIKVRSRATSERAISKSDVPSSAQRTKNIPRLGNFSSLNPTKSLCKIFALMNSEADFSGVKRHVYLYKDTHPLYIEEGLLYTDKHAV